MNKLENSFFYRNVLSTDIFNILNLIIAETWDKVLLKYKQSFLNSTSFFFKKNTMFWFSIPLFADANTFLFPFAMLNKILHYVYLH
jgi:hypothetical protein